VNEVWTPENQTKVQLTFERSNINQTGCRAIGKLAQEIEEFTIKFNAEHAKHFEEHALVRQDSNISLSEDCVCCSNDISFNGLLLNTEHGFLLCDEGDFDVLSSFGIQQK
jgi:hypothetical protein